MSGGGPPRERPRAAPPAETAGTPAPVRTFDEPQIAEILRRAAALGREADARAPEPELHAPPGLTLEELTAIAQEAGLDPALVRRAAAALPLAAPPPRLQGPRWLGAPLSLELHARLAGPSDAPALAALADELRRRLGEGGPITVEEGRLSVSGAEARVPHTLHVETDARGTALVLAANQGRLAAACLGAGGLLGAVAGGFLGLLSGAALPALALLGLGMAAGLALGRAAFARLAGARRAELQAAFDALLALASRTPDPPRAP